MNKLCWRRQALFALPISVLVLVAAVLFLGLNQEDIPQSPLIDQQAPPVDIPTLYGSGRLLLPQDAMESDRPFLVNFFASWCLPCRAEHPLLNSLTQAGHPVFGIAHRDDPSDSRRFLEELGNPYKKVGIDANRVVGIDWGLYGLPETFLLDRRGHIRLRIAGPLDEFIIEERLKPAWRALEQ